MLCIIEKINLYAGGTLKDTITRTEQLLKMVHRTNIAGPQNMEKIQRTR